MHSKTNPRTRRALAAALGGILAGSALALGCGQPSQGAAVEANGCNGPNGCSGEKTKTATEPNGCNGPNGCSSEGVSE